MKRKKSPDKKDKKKKTVSTGKKPVKRGKSKEWSIDETNALLKSLIDKEREILQTEDALVEAMRRFRDLFEQSPIGVGIHNPEGEFLMVNKAYLEIFGLDNFGQIMQQNLFKDLKLPGTDINKIRAGKVVQHESEYDFDKVDFETIREGTGYVLFTISPISREKEVIGYMVQCQDITQRRMVEESHRLAQLGRLLSDMAHEVNNPLMIISGRAEFALIEGVKDEKMKDVLNVILDQCFFAKDIIQRLLKYARLGKVEKKLLDVSRTLDLISSILEHHFHISNIVFEKDITRDLPLVMGNDKQLQEVFMNIMRNSADAMPNGGVITLKVYREGDFLRIDIKDNGEGMTQKVLENVFEPFFTTKQQGTGLGLAVSHTIVQEHGGKMLYESEIDAGTTATVLLPAVYPA
ncbi:MAG: ATP-binding protein [Candidatus Omnitrophota bacterium]|nr:ATP-binding protein [Candidatus Omnitrophota bacterium]